MADQNIIKAIAKWGKDKLGNIIAYKTLTRCVFDDDGNRLSDILASGGTGTAALMTNEDAGVGRPDGTTIEVKENGIFGLVNDNINVDDTLSNTSTNPVQNKVVNAALLMRIQFKNYLSTSIDCNLLTDYRAIYFVNGSAEPNNLPTGFGGGILLNSMAGSTSAANYQYVIDFTNGKQYFRKYYHGAWTDWQETNSGITIDSALSEISTNPVQNKVVTEKLNNIKEELGVNTSKDNLWLDAYTKDKYTYDYPGYSDLGVFANSTYYPNTQISSKELRHYIGLGKYRLSFYAKVYSELETTVNVPLDITCLYKDNSKLEKTITITNNEQYFEIDFDFDKSVTKIQLDVKAGQCLIKNVTLLCMSNVEEKIDKLRKALCDLGK